MSKLHFETISGDFGSVHSFVLYIGLVVVL